MSSEGDYLHRLFEFFKKNQGKKYTVEELSKSPSFFIKHVKYYIDNRHVIEGYVDVSFNDDYTEIKIHEQIQTNNQKKRMDSYQDG